MPTTPDHNRPEQVPDQGSADTSDSADMSGRADGADRADMSDTADGADIPDGGANVTIEREVRADPEHVWELVTDPNELGEWLGGEVDLEVEPGAEGTVEFADDDGGLRVVYVEDVEPGRRLTLRWASASEVPSQVTIGVAPSDVGTVISVTETVVPPGQAVAGLGSVMLAGAR